MIKHIILCAVLAAVSAVALADNPFLDVPSDSWAYGAVTELAESGLARTDDIGYFQGDRPISRYEAAEITAKAMANLDKATLGQRSLINRLADEYADELNSLGLRITSLEEHADSLTLSGDTRLRYRYEGRNSSLRNDNAWDYRVRLRTQRQINSRTRINAGFSSRNMNFGSHSAGDDDDPEVDMMNVQFNFG